MPICTVLQGVVVCFLQIYFALDFNRIEQLLANFNTSTTGNKAQNI
jgi:hypothetical protein